MATASAVASFRSIANNTGPPATGRNSPAFQSAATASTRTWRQPHQLLGNGADNHRTRAFHPLGADHDQPGLVLPGHIHQHLGHRALANLRVAMDAFPNQTAGQFVQSRARLIGELPQDPAGHSIDRGIVQRVQAVREHNPGTVCAGHLAGILQSCFRAPSRSVATTMVFNTFAKLIDASRRRVRIPR